ncbi:MAG TPA: serine/threonine-protein kinase, partial [Thermoanaerobaculia bacterium]
MIGRTLSHYRIERRLGAGGMGEVFLARDLAFGRPAAIKILSQPLSSPLRSRLLREAEACARLQHPAIATFYEAGESDGTFFLALEFVPGETLRERLHRGPLPLSEAMTAAGCLLEALNHAHAAGVLHRDIKPENVMVTGGGLAKLLDFGVARLLGARSNESEAPTAAALTEVGAVVGTLGYMSPEQLKAQPLDERSDLFALGAVIYEA